MSVIHGNEKDFENLINNDLIVVDFFATWCGPCKMLGQVLETMEDVNIIKINVDEEEELAKRYKIMSIPNLLIIKDGEIKKQLIGFRSKEELLKEIDNVK